MNAALAVTALFNGAWQGGVLCALAVVAFRVFRRLNAATMFIVWSALLLIAVTLPVANYVFAPKPYTVRVVAPVVRVTHKFTAARVGEKPLPHSPVVLSAARQNEPVQAQASMRERGVALAHAVLSKSPVLLLILAIIALLRLGVLGRDVIRMLMARRRVRFIESPVSLSGTVGRPFRFAASRDFTSPCVLGFAPALIVLPEELLEEHNDGLLSIVLHEREHVRRFDDIQNVVQRFIGALAFFCPGVRIALRELALYREQICDDAAVNATGDRLSYAMTLTGMAQWAQGRGAPVPSFIFKRKQLLHRLEVLLDSAVSHSLVANRRFAISAATVIALATLLVLRVQMPVVAQSIVVPPLPPLPPKAAPRKPAPPTKVPALRELSRLQKPVIVPFAIHRPPKVRIAPIAPPLHVHAVKIAALIGVPAPHVAPPSVVHVSAPGTTFAAPARMRESNDVLDALNAAGLQNLSVDDLIAIRDHGVSAQFIRAAVSYFGRIGARDLTYLSDHGVGPKYIDTLRSSGVAGITPASAVLLMDHGANASLIRSAMAYYSPRPSAADLARLADHGVSGSFVDSLRSTGLRVCVDDTVRMLDHGVTAAYIMKIQRTNPRASIDDIIRLHDAGF
jgi:beta-lactamase regulating signal transducer with metallopeptidase domain